MVGKTAGTTVQVKAMTPNCSNSHCPLHCQAPAKKKKRKGGGWGMSVSLTNILEKALNIIMNFMNLIYKYSSFQYRRDLSSLLPLFYSHIQITSSGF